MSFCSRCLWQGCSMPVCFVSMLQLGCKHHRFNIVCVFANVPPPPPPPPLFFFLFSISSISNLWS